MALCFGVLVAVGQAYASAVQLPLTFYDQGNGLTSLSVVRLFEDHEGFLWVGTEKGLYRFDGLGFNAIGHNRGFQTSEVVGLAEDAGDHLWVALRAGLQRRGDDGNFTWVAPGGKTLFADRGQSLAADDRGGMLVVSGHQPWRLAQDDAGRWTSAPLLQGTAADGIGDVTAVLHRSGTTWFGCAGALCRLSNGVLTRFGTDRGVPADKWVGLLASRDGSLWARGIRHVIRLAPGASAFTTHDIPGGHTEVAASSIDIVEDRAGRILTRTDVGVARWDGAKWELFDPGNGLPGVGISSMVADQDGMVWMGTYGRGLVYWSSADAVENWTSAQGLSGSLIWSIARGDAHTVWLAGESGGEVIVPAEARAHRWPLSVPPPNQAHAVIADGKGGIWYFLFDGRVLRYDTAAGTTTNVAALPYLLRGAHLDRAGHFWAYTLGGLYEIDPVGAGATPAAPGLIPSTMCSDMAEDADGRLWVGCSSGLYRHNAKGWSRVRVMPTESSGGYENVAVTPDGRLWLSSLQPGLFVGHVTDADAVTVAPVNDPLLADTRFYFLRTDRRGRLWAGGGNGVDVADGNTWTRLSMRDGLLWDETNHGAFLADDDGTVWIGAPVGLTHVLDPDQLLAPRHIRPLLLSAHYGESEVAAASPTLPFKETAPLVLRFGVLGNSAGHPVRFRYRLPGLDEDWVDTAQREVRYASLPPGQYRFELTAVDVNRRTSSEPVTLDFTVAPPWWQTPWAYAIEVLLLIALIALAWRWRTRRLIAHAQRLEGIVQERTAELRQSLQARRMLLAHVGHDLRAPLGAVMNAVRQWRAGNTRRDYPQIIERHVRQQVDLIDDLLEFSRGELTGLRLEPVPGYLHGFLHDVAEQAVLLVERHGNRFACHFDEHLPPVVSADFRRLRQVLLNLLGNAAKFTHDGAVAFHADAVPERGGRVRLVFTVEDDGIGFDPAALESLQQPFARGDNANQHEGSGLGLAIVVQLLQHMGTRLEAERLPSGGSRFSFAVALPLADEDDLEAELEPGGEIDEPDGEGRVVLVVEPHAARRAVVCDLLDGYGFQSIGVADAAKALDVLRHERADLVITEQQLPRGDGWQLLQALRAESPDVPVLLYTATSPLRPADARATFDAVLLKPATAAELVTCVVRLIAAAADEEATPMRDRID
ncbi:response regulator [Luteibacter flocculans]|uniref:histidine kinase n=1 Tax=Luteibacter flocculans TaxID=2780091 RepID=A0ABY4SW15_9GAMM|nr:ATP-binding protein [Luteibacter flocculans]URL56894.1 response regulator [Luteibacter flocculans]